MKNMRICPVCSSQLKDDYKCENCGYDRREDFIHYRTVCQVESRELFFLKVERFNPYEIPEHRIPIGRMQTSIQESVTNFVRVLRKIGLQKKDLQKAIDLRKKILPRCYNVELTSVGNKVSTIGAVWRITGFSLKDAKELVENVPSIIKIGVSKEEAEKIKQQLEVLGAKITISG